MTKMNVLFKFLGFNDFIKNNLVLISIVFGLILVGLVIVLIRIMLKKKSYQKELNKIQQKYINARQIALPDAIAKLETLSMKNISFVKLYRESNTRFYEINDKYNGQINEKFKLATDYANSKNYKLLMKEMKGLDVLIAGFSDELAALYEKVASYTAEEDKILKELKTLKEEYINDQKIFHDNANALAIIAPRIKEIMKKTSLMFEECEGNLSAGVYIECYEVIEKIRFELTELNKYLDKMPGLLTWTTQNIVKKLNELIDKNNSMQNEYPLHHLLPTRKIEKLVNEFNLMIERIKELNANGMEDYMKDIYEQISCLSDALDKEKEARQLYDEECENLYDLSDRVSRDYIKLQKEIEGFNKVYSMTKEMESYIEECNSLKDQLTESKQNMDNNIYGHQPYSIRYENIKQLKKICEDFKNLMEAFPNMAQRLKEDAESAHDSIEVFAQRIKMTKIEIDNCNLPLFAKRYWEKLKKLEEKLEILVNSLKVPVKIQIAMAAKKELEVETISLKEDVDRKVKLLGYCEELITITNRYRSNFGEVNNAVNRAVTFFNEGEFESIVPLLLKLNSFDISFPTFEEYLMQKRI